MTTALIAGSRDLPWNDEYFKWLDKMHENYVVSEIIHGGAKGADALGDTWARHKNLPVKVFPALWKTHGKMAGPMRNREMAEYLQLKGVRTSVVLLFPGGIGTENMYRAARALNLRIERYV